MLIQFRQIALGRRTKTEMEQIKEEESALLKLRKSRNLTQKQLAEALGVTVQTVSNWEVGRAEPKLTIRQFKILLKVLQCTIEQIPDDLGPSKSDVKK
ncbi:MAG: helix-turn-helix transcriptional regulator [Coleofasciculaceae cyanobacterium]